MTSVGIIVLAEDAIERGVVIVGRGKVRADEKGILGADWINYRAKNVGRPKIVDRAEEKNDAFGAGGIERLEEPRKFRAVREFAKERGGLEAVEGGGGSLFSGEDHFEADVGGSVNDGAAGLADQLQTASVLSAVTARQADNMNNIATTNFRCAAKGRIVQSRN